MPHFLYPKYLNRRPSKDYIKQHQELNDRYYSLWKSKSCIATADDSTKEALNTPTPEKPKKSPPNTQSSNSSISQTPKFDHADTLMNDDIDVIPGFNLDDTTKPEENKEVNGTSFNVNHTEENDTNNNDNDKKRKMEEVKVDSEPPSKKRKLNGQNGHANMNGHSPISETTDNRAPPKVAKQEEVNYVNQYYEIINWDNPFDRSPTWELAHKLYKKSQNFVSWQDLSHDITATATHVMNICMNNVWKRKLEKVLRDDKYQWNGCKFKGQLTKQLMDDLAHDIAYNYIKYQTDKKKKIRRYLK